MHASCFASTASPHGDRPCAAPAASSSSAPDLPVPTWCARWPGTLPADATLTLLSDESYTTFNPMLPEAVGASVFPEHVVVPVREMLRPGAEPPVHHGLGGRGGHALHASSVCRTLAGEIVLGYEHLVLAFGNRARIDLMPGMAEHALPLKTIGDAMQIRNTVLRRLARIELESDAALRRQLGQLHRRRWWLLGGRGGRRTGGLPAQHPSLLPAHRGATNCRSRCCTAWSGCCPSCRRGWAPRRCARCASAA